MFTLLQALNELVYLDSEKLRCMEQGGRSWCAMWREPATDEPRGSTHDPSFHLRHHAITVGMLCIYLLAYPIRKCTRDSAHLAHRDTNTHSAAQGEGAQRGAWSNFWLLFCRARLAELYLHVYSCSSSLQQQQAAAVPATHGLQILLAAGVGRLDYHMLEE